MLDYLNCLNDFYMKFGAYENYISLSFFKKIFDEKMKNFIKAKDVSGKIDIEIIFEIFFHLESILFMILILHNPSFTTHVDTLSISVY